MSDTPVPLVLGYSISHAKAEALRRLCTGEGAAYFAIQPRHYTLPLALLPVADAGAGNGSPQSPPPFPEEMLLFKGFTDAALARFLQSYRAAGLEKIELKAALTPYNSGWDSIRLRRELMAERDAMRRARP